jgi:hypothetical protein
MQAGETCISEGSLKGVLENCTSLVCLIHDTSVAQAYAEPIHVSCTFVLGYFLTTAVTIPYLTTGTWTATKEFLQNQTIVSGLTLNWIDAENSTTTGAETGFRILLINFNNSG